VALRHPDAVLWHVEVEKIGAVAGMDGRGSGDCGGGWMSWRGACGVERRRSAVARVRVDRACVGGVSGVVGMRWRRTDWIVAFNVNAAVRYTSLSRLHSASMSLRPFTSKAPNRSPASCDGDSSTKATRALRLPMNVSRASDFGVEDAAREKTSRKRGGGDGEDGSAEKTEEYVVRASRVYRSRTDVGLGSVNEGLKDSGITSKPRAGSALAHQDVRVQTFGMTRIYGHEQHISTALAHKWPRIAQHDFAMWRLLGK
jgi:hypothetical protein